MIRGRDTGTHVEADNPVTEKVRANFVHVVLDDLNSAYLEDDRPWVVGFSGGKDSTALAQLVYYMLARLPSHQRRRRVYLLASDTRVEAPSISARIRKELSLIDAAAERDKLPLTTHLVFPRLNDTFWVNMIGRGYPSPIAHFRWCTDRLKIKPASEFIKSVVNRSGAVIILLGARKEESASRARSMQAHSIEGQRYRPHVDLPRAWVYTPLQDLTTNEIWVYLLQVPSPWAGDNRGLITLYRRAGGGECPLVIDTTTPACGQSRFGCWTCTVVEKDRSMEALALAGQENLWPLLLLRDYLKEIRDKRGSRYNLRRNGQAPLRRSTGESMTNTGPFTHKMRMEILRRVLDAQKQAGMQIIEGDELEIIQEIWNREESDHPDKPSVPRNAVSLVWRHVFKEQPMPSSGHSSPKDLAVEDRLLHEVCKECGISFEMMCELRDVEEKFSHLKRRHGLPEEMRDVVRKAVRH